MKNRDKAFTEAIRRKIEQRPSPSRSPLGLAPVQPDQGNDDYVGTTLLLQLQASENQPSGVQSNQSLPHVDSSNEISRTQQASQLNTQPID